jgi:formylglycine-generating enzyme required for sulfatase activity
LQPFADDIRPRLRELWAEPDRPDNRPMKLRIGLALLPAEPAVKDRLAEWLLDVRDPQEFRLVRDALQGYAAELKGRLWTQLEDAHAPEDIRFRAAAALALYARDDPRWAADGRLVAGRLAAEDPLLAARWVEVFRPVRARLLAPLSDIFRDGRRPEAERRLATALLVNYAADRPEVLAELLMEADNWQFAELLPKLQVHGEQGTEPLRIELTLTGPGDAVEPPLAWAVPLLDYPGVLPAVQEAAARRQARAAVALLRLGQADAVWPLFRQRPNPEARSQLLARLAPLAVDPVPLMERLAVEPDVSARRTLILALGEYGPERLPPKVRQPVTVLLLRWYRDDPDPGIHGAIDWLLRPANEGPTARPLNWGQAEALARVDQHQAFARRQAQLGALVAAPVSPLHLLSAWYVPPQDPAGRRWYVTGAGQTLAVMPQPDPFWMGSPGAEVGRRSDEVQHRRQIGRSYAIATRAVTVRQYEEFAQAYPRLVPSAEQTQEISPELDCPIVAVDWYVAAAYCRWLSEREGVPEDQMCYPTIDEILARRRDGQPLKLYADYLSRTGYRLPTEAEWEYACRAGTVSARSYGSSEELLPRYAWYQDNSGKRRTWPVGQKRPNDRGLFDVHGNVWTLCQEAYAAYPRGTGVRAVEDKEDNSDITDRMSRVLRGGAFDNPALNVRSACRDYNRPANRSLVGLRLARTYR